MLRANLVAGAALCATVLSLVATAANADLMVDVGTNFATPSGWHGDSGTITGNAFEADANGITVSSAGSSFSSAFAPSDAVYVALDSLSSPASGIGQIFSDYRVFGSSLTLSNLLPGAYTVIAFGGEGRTGTHTISANGGGGAVSLGTTQDIASDNPGGLTAQQIFDSVTVSGTVTIDAGKTLLISSTGDLNGVILTPEPASLAMLSLGGLGVLMRRRRA